MPERAEEGLGRLRAPGRVDLQTPSAELFPAPAVVRGGLPDARFERGRGAVAAVGRVGSRWERSGRDLRHEDAERVQVGRRAEFPAGDLLRCHVCRGADRTVPGRRPRQPVHRPRDAEIRDHGPFAPTMHRYQHDVAWLEVTVEDSLPVRRRHPGGDLRDQLSRDRLVKRTVPAQTFGKRLALEQLHAQEQRRLSRAPEMEFEHAADVGVRDPPGEEDLPPESLQPSLGRPGLQTHRLHCDARPERDVDRLVDLPHAATTEHPDDAEPRLQHRAGR